VLFQIINKFFSNPAFSYQSQFSTGTLKFQIASLLIITPIFLAIIGHQHKNYKENKLNPQSGVYRWLTYLMLFIAALNIIGSLIALVFKLLDGEYTVGSLLKIGVVFLIALGIFGHYWIDLKRHDYSSRSKMSQTAFIIVVALTVAAIVGGFILAPSPQVSRDLNFDRQRAEDLTTLRFQVDNFYSQNEKLPEGEDLEAQQFSLLSDPETQEPYEYIIVSPDEYEICATFALSIKDFDDNTRYPRYNEEWYYHEAGRQCFTQKINDLRIKPILLRE